MFKAIVFCLIAASAATPTRPNAGPTNQQFENCGSNAKIYCCNSENASKMFSSGILAGDSLQNLLGQCNDVTATVIGGAVPIKNPCKDQAVCCGETSQNGLVNVGCTPFNVA